MKISEMHHNILQPEYFQNAPEWQVAVVIPTLYRSRYLDRVLELLACQSVQPAEVVVIDQADRSEFARGVYERYSRTLPLRVYHMDVRSQSAARNWGIRLTHSPIILSVDDDTEFDEHLIFHHLRAMLRFEADCISGGVVHRGGTLHDTPRTPPAWECGIATFIHTPLVDFACPAIGIAGCNFAVKRSAAEAIGGWDEQIRVYGEDRDFPLRLLKQGFRVMHEPQALVVHLKAPQGGGRYSRRRPNIGQRLLNPLPEPGYLYFYRKHFSPYAALAFLVSIVLRGWPHFAKYRWKTLLATPFRAIAAWRSWRKASELLAGGERLLGATPKAAVTQYMVSVRQEELNISS